MGIRILWPASGLAGLIVLFLAFSGPIGGTGHETVLTMSAATASPAQEQQVRPAAQGPIEAAAAPHVVARRARLIAAHKDSLIIIPSQYRSGQGMRDNLNFLYLTGMQEADAVLVLNPSGNPREAIFRRRAAGAGARGPVDERGGEAAGHGMSATGAAGSGVAGTGSGSVRETREADGAQGPQSRQPSAEGPSQGVGPKEESITIAERPLDELAAALRGAVGTVPGRARRILLPFSDLDFISRAFAGFNPLSQTEEIVNIDPTLAEMRLTKDEVEIAALREAIALTAEALREAYRAAEPGVREIDLAALMRFVFNRRETKDSFLQAASGPNSTQVHFGATTRALEAGDLVLLDVGAYVRGYTSDITRTIPANGRFTREQRAIYELVLEAQKEGCRRLVPGVTFKAVQDEVEAILMRGLERLGLVTDAKNPWQRRLYIQHGFGHGIGLDVHDSWSWHSPRLDKVVMAPGMVMTMEPGLYFPEARFEAFLDALKGKAPETEIAAFRERVGPVYKRYAGFGVRIEDDILITEGGNEVLSAGAPKEIAEIERLMREKSAINLGVSAVGRWR